MLKWITQRRRRYFYVVAPILAVMVLALVISDIVLNLPSWLVTAGLAVMGIGSVMLAKAVRDTSNHG